MVDELNNGIIKSGQVLSKQHLKSALFISDMVAVMSTD
jgi:hypothetical protein